MSFSITISLSIFFIDLIEPLNVFFINSRTFNIFFIHLINMIWKNTNREWRWFLPARPGRVHRGLAVRSAEDDWPEASPSPDGAFGQARPVQEQKYRTIKKVPFWIKYFSPNYFWLINTSGQRYLYYSFTKLEANSLMITRSWDCEPFL